MPWPTWLKWYKKPEYRDIKEYSTAVGSGTRSFSPDGRGGMIPSQLKLERVLENKTCSPMSLFDFYMYLKHIEYSEENLEFYIWYKDFERNHDPARMQREGDGGNHGASRGSADGAPVVPGANPRAPSVKSSADEAGEANAVLNRIAWLLGSGAPCTQASKCQSTLGSHRPLPSRTGHGQEMLLASDASSSTSTTTLAPASSESACGEELTELGVISRTFLRPGAPKELNIPPALRSKALAGLQASDPGHLRPVADHVYQLLRTCSHRNFVRLGVSNGTFETICVATGLGIFLTLAGFLSVLLFAFVPHRAYHSSWTVLGAWPMWSIGMSLIMSGLRGSCFFLLLFSRRQPLPWERFTDAEMGATQRRGLLRLLSRLMIFDRKFRVKDVHLRHLQHKIVVQSLVAGASFATCSALLFIFLPVWSNSS
ncbi:hypothetical protein RJ55_01923 [Drechmeria coniospora]|nr:hypothetical protein RJ55_01923 [Drechmeria coniospora]